jgi:UDP-2,3-diacylglucosamine hydrolase
MADKRERLALVAGGGPLPERLMAACRERGREVVVIGLEGQADPAWCRGVAQATVRLGEGGKLIRLLRDAQASAVVFAGRVRRPPWRELRPDWATMRFFARLLLQGRLGDNAIVGGVVDRFEREGFRVIAPQDLLGETVAVGPLGRARPSPEQERGILLGVDAARAIGRLDIGHAVVVQDGAVVAVEGAEGTDALIRRCAALPRGGRGAILVKVSKPQQDPRADPPTIGADTVAHASAVGFGGIAFEADRTLVVDLPEMIRAADAAGLFLVGLATDR